MASITERRLLVLIVDACQQYRQSINGEDTSQILSFQDCMNQMITFINSYILSSQFNSVCVVLCHQAGCNIVYPLADGREGEGERGVNDGRYEPISIMNGLLRNEMNRIMSNIAISAYTMLSAAISKSLCYIQRCHREVEPGDTLKPRLLVIRCDKDSPIQHISTMNCIFAAQKQNITIDGCVLWEESSYLQQAADLTGGIYIRIPEPAALLQFLLWVFLPDVQCRSLLSLPVTSTIDYRASCFCHHKLVDVGFVCSVCLAIFCNFIPICSVCQTHFKLPSLLTLKPKKKNKTINKQKAKQSI